MFFAFTRRVGMALSAHADSKPYIHTFQRGHKKRAHPTQDSKVA